MSDVYQRRISAIRDLLAEWQVEALLVSSAANRRWLTGFTGTAGTVLITAEKAMLATDSRYWEQAEEQAPAYDLYRELRTPQDTIAFLNTAAVSIFGLEANHFTLQQARELQAAPGLTFVHLDAPVEPLRCVKTAVEIDAMRAAARITDETMARLPQLARLGITEKQLAWELEKQMRELGATGVAFTPIVAFGPNSARPHHRPSDRPLQAGEVLLVDMGASLDGYCSDLTRTFFVGPPAGGQFAQVFDLVAAAQARALQGIRPGMSTQEAHALAANVINQGGFGDYFGHGLGHGIGLEIHETPFMSATRPPQRLVEGTTLTVEPGIYLPGWGGVRIEDLVVLTAVGTSALSSSPREPYLLL